MADSQEPFKKKIYYVNEELYIIFDWDIEKITAQAGTEEMLKLIYKKYGYLNENTHSDTLYSPYGIRLVDEKYELLKNIAIIPNVEDTFEFLDK